MKQSVECSTLRGVPTLVDNGFRFYLVQVSFKFIVRAVRKAGIADLYGLANKQNTSGDDVKKASEVLIMSAAFSGCSLSLKARLCSLTLCFASFCAARPAVG